MRAHRRISFRESTPAFKCACLRFGGLPQSGKGASPFVGASLFWPGRVDFRVEPRFRIEPRFQKENKKLCLPRRVGRGDRGDVARKNRGVLWLVH
ncbi:hypothetical protein GGP66_002723 [Salinibacter ruber]|nr:hypothetical protein [Salinibacter ruber]